MIIDILAVVVTALIIFFLWKVVKKIFIFAINSVIGIFAMIGLNYLFNWGIVINFWSAVVVAIGGIIGVIIVIILHFTGLAF
ncbi:pro-sigmaK processing inhibitor BofA family protein [Candidatus Woesearchaeota archaeon]|nr:pro-sigmaK processing inhibitor BofA family protein [Candidatus Woesearchaeota archaeon]